MCAHILKQLSNIVWSFATLEASGIEDLLLLISEKCSLVILQLNTQELSNLVWAVAKLKFFNKNLMTLAADAVIKNIKLCFPQALANITWAYATLGVRDDLLFNAIASAVCGYEACLVSRDIAQITWAFARQKQSFDDIEIPSLFLQNILACTSKKLTQFNAVDTIETMWGLGHLKYIANDLYYVINDTLSNLAARLDDLVDDLSVLDVAFAFSAVVAASSKNVSFTGLGESFSSPFPLFFSLSNCSSSPGCITNIHLFFRLLKRARQLFSMQQLGGQSVALIGWAVAQIYITIIAEQSKLKLKGLRKFCLAWMLQVTNTVEQLNWRSLGHVDFFCHTMHLKGDTYQDLLLALQQHATTILPELTSLCLQVGCSFILIVCFPLIY